MNLAVWAGESFKIARQKEVQYCVIEGNKCKYLPDSLTHIDHGEGENVNVLNLTSEYEDQFSAIVTQRLQQAGIRLGALLNNIFDPQ